MKTGFLRLLGIILICALPAQVARADVAPPVEIVAVPLALIIGLCLVVLIIAVASFFVIRAIKKSHPPKDGA
jgi:hypothetical protein